MDRPGLADGGPLARASSPPPTPTSFAFDQANATVSELAASLSTASRRVSSEASAASSSTPGTAAEWEEERRALEREVVMVAQIGQALLERQEAYRLKTEKELEGLRQHKEQAAALLLEANDQLQTARQTNENLVAQLAGSTRETGALERRLLQSLTSLTLSDSSIATLRGEITSLRGALSKQAGAQARSTGWEDKIRQAEKQRDENKEELNAERRKRVESERRGHKAQERISELEVKLNAARREIETASRTKEELVEDVARQVKTRMQGLHEEWSSQANAGGSPNPEVQQVLEGLMAENVTLKGDNGELRDLLNEYRQTHAKSPHTAHFEASIGGDSAFSDGEGQAISRSSTAFFSDELAASTASRPHVDRTHSADAPGRYSHGRQDSWAPSVRSAFAAQHRHGRTDSWTPSLAPSYASSSSYGAGPGSVGMLSPTGQDEEFDSSGLGLGSSGFPAGGKKGIYSLSGSARRFKDKNGSSSSSAGPNAWQRGHVKRSFSVDRPRGVQRAFSNVGSIAERSATDDEATASAADTPEVDAFSPSSLDAGRNLARYDIVRRSSAPPGPDGPHASSSQDLSLLTLDDLGQPQISPEKRKVRRRPMLLLSKTKGVQTDPVDFGTSTDDIGSRPPLRSLHQPRPSISPSVSTTTSDFDSRRPPSHASSPTLPSYTSAAGTSSDASQSPNDPRTIALTSLIDHMARLLTRLSQADVQTLTKRLKRQHLPGDVGHLSKSTLCSIMSEIDDLRNHFRGILEAERKQDWGALHSAADKEKLDSLVTRKDFLALVKLFKDVFTELSTLRLTVNEIVLDPASAARLRERVLADEEDETIRPTLKPRNTSGLGGWISAPISKFFITPPVETSEDDSSTIGSGKLSPSGTSGIGNGAAADRGRLHPSRAAPKLAAATASTATTVNVEFASGGAVRRATATTSAAAGPAAASDRPDSPVIRPPSAQGLAPPSEPTVRSASPTRPSTSNRANLRGIFAGASSSGSAVAAPASSWLMASGGGGGAPAGRLRHAASSSVLRPARAMPAMPLGGSPTKRMSSAVDAVLDPATSSAIGSNIYERKLRRTASDESIRSHYLEPAVGPAAAAGHSSLGRGAPPFVTRKPPAATRTASGGGGMFANLSSRLLAFAGEGSSASLLAGADSLDPSAAYESTSSPTSSAGFTPSSLARPSFLSSRGSSGWDDGRPV